MKYFLLLLLVSCASTSKKDIYVKGLLDGVKLFCYETIIEETELEDTNVSFETCNKQVSELKNNLDYYDIDYQKFEINLSEE